VKIGVSMYIMELEVCDKHQALVAGGYFRQFWNDPRLAYDFGDQASANGEMRTTLL
jgi:hypothetical protein